MLAGCTLGGRGADGRGEGGTGANAGLSGVIGAVSSGNGSSVVEYLAGETPGCNLIRHLRRKLILVVKLLRDFNDAGMTIERNDEMVENIATDDTLIFRANTGNADGKQLVRANIELHEVHVR